jgi:Flp pilus assembly protein TadD
MDLEGDAIGPVADEISWLRPFGRDVASPPPPPPGMAGEPEAVAVPRQARELAALGRQLDALLLLRRYLDDAPGDAAVRGLLAELLDQGGETEAALAEYTLALTTAPDPVELLVRRGDLLARCGRGGEAELDLREAIRQRRDYAPAHYYLGVTLLRRGLAAEAADAFRAALKCAPNDPESTYYLGEAQEAQGDLPAALRTLERAAVLAPGDPRSYKLMGRLLDRMGRSEDAMAMHKKAREAIIR